MKLNKILALSAIFACGLTLAACNQTPTEQPTTEHPTTEVPSDPEFEAVSLDVIKTTYKNNQEVVVEGVEELSQVEFLSQFEGCILQGYYYSRPIKTEEFEEKLEESIKM